MNREDLRKILRGKCVTDQACEAAIDELLNLHSVSDSSDFELQRLFDWLQDPKRKPAQTKFTAGMTRNVAKEFEYALKHSR